MSGSAPTWPFACPTSWEEIGIAAQVRTEVEQGLPKQRPRFTKTWRTARAQWAFRDRAPATYTAIRDFIETSLAGGVLAFDMPHPVSAATIRVRFVSYPQIKVSATDPTITVAGELEEVFT